MAWGSRRLSLRLGDYRRVLLSALDTVDHSVALITITPPGDVALPPSEDGYRRWNRAAARRWAKLDRRAKGRLRRHGLRLRPLARVAQRQRRGLDHVHLVVALEHAGDRMALAAYVAHLKELGPEYGFGFIDDPMRRRWNRAKTAKRDMVFESASIAGRYLCRYLAESEQLASMISAGDHSFRPLWVSPLLTQASGVTVRRLRRVRHAYFVVKAREQGSWPTHPVWWGDLRERRAILSLLRPRVLAAAA
jgi:hypothetical protein